MVITGAYQPSYAKNLGVFALHGPGVRAGLLETSTTRRAGYVALQDIAPTILDRVGVEPPTTMEGRPAESTRVGGEFAGRVQRLARENRASMFRDANIGAAMVALAVVVVIVTLLGLGVLLVPALARFRRAFVFLCLSVLGLMAATFVVEPFPFFDWGAGPYWLAVVGIALAFGAVTAAFRRAGWMVPVMVATGALIALHTIDLLLGAHLQFATVFG